MRVSNKKQVVLGLGLFAGVVAAASQCGAAAIVQDGFTLYGSAPNNTTTLAGRTPDTAGPPGSTYVVGGNNGGTGPVINTGVGNPSPAVQTNGNGDVAINLNGLAPNLITISADVELNTLTQATGNTYRGVGLGFYSTPAAGGTEANTRFTGLIVNAGNSTDGAAGTLRLIANGTPSATIVAAPFSGFSATSFYNLSYTVNTTSGAITNVTFNGNNDTASFTGTNATAAFTTAATAFAAFYGSTDTNINFTGYVDNFTVSPEPASLGLLGLGSLALLARRRTRPA